MKVGEVETGLDRPDPEARGVLPTFPSFPRSPLVFSLYLDYLRQVRG